MNHRSKKMAAIYVLRRKLVRELLADNPLCERCEYAYATDCHEIKSRARGGSILDRDNIRVLCRACHTWITMNPQLAHDDGWLVNSWE